MEIKAIILGFGLLRVRLVRFQFDADRGQVLLQCKNECINSIDFDHELIDREIDEIDSKFEN